MLVRLRIVPVFRWSEPAEVIYGLSPRDAGQNWQVRSPISGPDIGDQRRGDGDLVAFGEFFCQPINLPMPGSSADSCVATGELVTAINA